MVGPGRRHPGPGRIPGDEDSDLRQSLLGGGLRGIAVVTAATIGVALVAALIALLVSLLY